MPTAAPRPCRAAACGALVRNGSGYCELHQSQRSNWRADKVRGNRHQRGYGREWEKLREVIIHRDDGLCQPCLRAGRVVSFSAVDHIVPKAQGGGDDPSNLQCICGACHREKTAAEGGLWGGGR